MTGQNITIPGPDGATISAYLALPPGGSGPGVCIGHDIFGMGPNQENAAALFAANGYVAMVPDMFWNIEPKTDTVPGVGEVTSYRGVFTEEDCMAVTECGIAALRARPECNGKIAMIGFCAGGTFAYLAAARLGIDAAASYYGTRIHTHLDEIGNVTCPTLLHICQEDRTYPEADRDRILAAAEGHPAIRTHVYTVKHGFAHHAESDEERQAAEIAHARTFEIFAPLK